MNIKLHTPKTLKNGSGMGSMKQFMLSLLATTVSIVLTFGTAAVIDSNKKQKEKREIVMMVVYDMSNSLKQFERADSMLQESVKLQLKIAEDTSQFQKLKFNFAGLLPVVNYTETTERIFFFSSLPPWGSPREIVFCSCSTRSWICRQRCSWRS